MKLKNLTSKNISIREGELNVNVNPNSTTKSLPEVSIENNSSLRRFVENKSIKILPNTAKTTKIPGAEKLDLSKVMTQSASIRLYQCAKGCGRIVETFDGICDKCLAKGA